MSWKSRIWSCCAAEAMMRMRWWESSASTTCSTNLRRDFVLNSWLASCLWNFHVLPSELNIPVPRKSESDSKWDEPENDTVHLDGVDSGVSGDDAFFYGNGNGDAEDEISSSLKIPSTKETLPIQEGSAADPNDGSNKDDQA
ncbi:uncharacterized protein HKW66_Vig0033940 [Vigna angularis]|uniref:Uncharacterized protein n=1 Tax=Phaseolus angularis TaxID=3914 RepID=A0A8T0LAI3_PHAAN|nr:uncharacterized protein HKW66_Vig0033940 [Vigna angularis]